MKNKHRHIAHQTKTSDETNMNLNSPSRVLLVCTQRV